MTSPSHQMDRGSGATVPRRWVLSARVGRSVSGAAAGLAAVLMIWLPAGSTLAQDGSFGGMSDADLESEEGLQSATPTDNLDEVANQANAGNLTNGAGDAPEPELTDAPGAGTGTDEGGDIQFGDEGGEDLFGEAGGGNGAAPAPNAYGNPAAPASNPALNPALNPATPPTTNPAAGTTTGNAQTLMNQIGPNAVGANGLPVQAPGDPGATTDPAATTPVEAGTEAAVAPPGPVEPEITAPPLPPPNEFAGAPPVPGTIRQVAEGAAPEEYVVDPGDTLFDICDQLLDEPTYWPRLWAMNPDIKNPHFIFPGMRLRFYPGDDDNPPYLQVVTEDDVIPIDKGDLDENELVAEKVIFDAIPTYEPLPIEVVGPEGVDDVEDVFEGTGDMPSATSIALTVPAFVFESEREPLGVVMIGREDEEGAGLGQQVMVERLDQLSPGTLYTVLRASGGLDNPETGDFVGYRYEFVGNLKMDRALESDPDVYVGTVALSRLQVRPEDLIVEYISTTRTVPAVPEVSSLSSGSANVIGFEYPDSQIGAELGLLMLDRGDGVSVGSSLPIYATPGWLSPAMWGPGIPEDYRQIGVVRVIDVTDAGAIAYIVRTKREIRLGDRVGSGKG